MRFVTASDDNSLPVDVVTKLGERFAPLGAGGGFDGVPAMFQVTVRSETNAAIPFGSSTLASWAALEDPDDRLFGRPDLMIADPTEGHSSVQVAKRGLYLLQVQASWMLGPVDPGADFELAGAMRGRISMGLEVNGGNASPAWYLYPNGHFYLLPDLMPTQSQKVVQVQFSFPQQLDVGDAISFYYSTNTDGAAPGNIGFKSDEIYVLATYAGEWVADD